MKIDFISDAHGNAYALRRCLERLEYLDVSSVFFLAMQLVIFLMPTRLLNFYTPLNVYVFWATTTQCLLVRFRSVRKRMKFKKSLKQKKPLRKSISNFWPHCVRL